jgi:rare lipoprotein A
VTQGALSAPGLPSLSRPRQARAAAVCPGSHPSRYACKHAGEGWPGHRRHGLYRYPATWAIISVLVTSGCTPATVLKPDPHYVLAKPFTTNNVWFYPRESYDLDETGLAVIANTGAPRLTTDGEVFDQTALAAADPTIQLPAIARLTNLENGRQVVVRVNDRGSGDPHRLIQITNRTAVLLAIPLATVARVRLQVLPNESHAAADSLPGAPLLAMTAAPRGSVEIAELAPLPGVRQGGGRALPIVPVATPAAPEAAAPLLRLPETITQTAPRPGRLMVQLDTFDEYQYAAAQRARMSAVDAQIVTLVSGRKRQFRVEIGPLPDVAKADAVLDHALASGIPDARIMVD